MAVVVVVLSHEAKILTEAWGLVMVSLYYCFCVGRLVDKGVKRLNQVAPVMLLFFLVPFHLTTVHMIGTTGFLISWLDNFKLLERVLSPYLPARLLLPRQGSAADDKTKLKQQRTREGSQIYLVKALLLLLLIHHILPDKAVLLLYGFNMYFFLDLILAVTASMVRAESSLELEPQFNEPYLATSLQDFWGKTMESNCHLSVRSCAKVVGAPQEMGNRSRGVGHVRGFGDNARAHILLHGEAEAFVGDNVFLPPTWSLHHGRDRPQEGHQQKVETSNSSGLDSDHIIRLCHWCLVVLPVISEVPDRPKGIRRVRGCSHLSPEKCSTIFALGASFSYAFTSLST